MIPYKLKHNFDKLYFIFDSAKCHTTPKVLNHLENNNIEAIIVPPRFTNLIQPTDVIWFSLLKGAYHELWLILFKNFIILYLLNRLSNEIGIFNILT